MKIREATESDLPAIVDIYNASIGSRLLTTSIQPTTVLKSTGWFRQQKKSGKPLLIAEDKGKVLGWLSIRPFYRRPAYDSTAKVRMYVSPESQGKGIGSQLLRRAIASCPAYGVKSLVSYVLAENGPAHRVFTKLGFDEWGYFPGVIELDDTSRDLIVLGRKL